MTLKQRLGRWLYARLPIGCRTFDMTHPRPLRGVSLDPLLTGDQPSHAPHSLYVEAVK